MMRFSIAQHIDQLNLIFERIWESNRGLIRDNAVHGVATSLPSILRPAHYEATGSTLTSPPRFRRLSSGVTLRVPGTGDHRLAFQLNLDIDVSARFHIDVSFDTTPATSTPMVTTAVNLPWYLDVGSAANVFRRPGGGHAVYQRGQERRSV